MDQLVSTISTTVALSVCAARLGADAQLEGVVRSRLASNGDTHTCIDRVPMQCFGRGSQKPSSGAFPRAAKNMVKLSSVPCTYLLAVQWPLPLKEGISKVDCGQSPH